jgi:hypothetical protein
LGKNMAAERCRTGMLFPGQNKRILWLHDGKENANNSNLLK